MTIFIENFITAKLSEVNELTQFIVDSGFTSWGRFLDVNKCERGKRELSCKLDPYLYNKAPRQFIVVVKKLKQIGFKINIKSVLTTLEREWNEIQYANSKRGKAAEMRAIDKELHKMGGMAKSSIALFLGLR